MASKARGLWFRLQPLFAPSARLAEATRMRHEGMTSESGTLATLRDTLLPRLISGELRVKHVAHFARQVIS